MADAGQLWATNTGRTYDRLSRSGIEGRQRFIGRCKKCGKTHKLEGELMSAFAARRGDRPAASDLVVRDNLGLLWTTAANGTDTALVWVPCGEHRCLLRRVVEGTKRSKHACGARCMNATGPSCDCRCRGKNHGANC